MSSVSISITAIDKLLQQNKLFDGRDLSPIHLKMTFEDSKIAVCLYKAKQRLIGGSTKTNRVTVTLSENLSEKSHMLHMARSAFLSLSSLFHL